MKKKTTLILVSILLIVGSFVSFYASNLIFSDVSNMFYGVHDFYIISSLPLFTFVIDFIIAILFVIRFYRYPQYKKALINLYTILIASMSLIGIITSILTGTIVYHSLIKPYPFAGSTIISLILHVLLLLSSLYVNIIVRKKLENDVEKKQLKFKNIIYTAFLSLLLFLSLYKTGTLLWAPIYIHLRSFYLTWPFYLWSILPIAIIAHIIMYFLDFYKNYKQSIIYLGIIFILNLILGISVMVIGYTHPLFISAISPALPLERLATKPLDVVSVFAIIFVVDLYYFFYSVRSYKLAKN